MAGNKRVCVIGAGPSGMAMVQYFNRLKKDGANVPEIVCYEKQEDWGGTYNYTWKTGVDEFGEPIHSSMYQHLWTNNPKECVELPGYTFDDHFGKPMPSFLPRAVLRDYLVDIERRHGSLSLLFDALYLIYKIGFWTTNNLRQYIRFSTVVTSVRFDEDSKLFTVRCRNLIQDVDVGPETFTHVVTATGMFSSPFIPHIAGIDTFDGRILHAHDFRKAREFQGQTIVIVGEGDSAKDITLHLIKYGAKRVIVSWRLQPMNLKWPTGVQERPQLKKVTAKTTHFKDESNADADCIIFCTGYRYNFPFIEDKLRLRSPSSFFPPNLYKGIMWTKGGDGRLFYLGVQKQLYTFTMFEVQSTFAGQVIIGEIFLPSQTEIAKDIEKWLKRIDSTRGMDNFVDYQTDYLMDLCEITKYPHNIDTSKMLHTWIKTRRDDIKTYRDHCYRSMHTGTLSAKPRRPYMSVLDGNL